MESWNDSDEKLIAVLMAVIHGLERQVAELTVHDPLTGALNRRQVEPTLLEAVERHCRWGVPVSVLVVSIDGAADILEQHGRAAAEGVLRDVAKVLRQRVRKLDRVFRMGDDELLVLLPGANGPQALGVADELRALVAQAPLMPVPGVTVSVGAAELAAGEPVDAWLWEAQAALCEARVQKRPVGRGERPFDHPSRTWRRSPVIVAANSNAQREARSAR